MGYRFQSKARGQLTKAITQTGTTIELPTGQYNAFLSGFSDGDLMCVLRDATQVEIIKVDIANSNQFSGLSVSRGQEGTSAPVAGWPIGTLIYAHITAAAFDNIIQTGEDPRAGAYNPNGILTPNYAYEEFYQTDELLWWKAISDIGTVWRLIAGVMNVADPTFLPVAGYVANDSDLTLSCLTSGAKIRYTNDGTDPDETSLLYSGSPVSIPNNATTTFKARAYHNDRWWTPSSIVSAEYIAYPGAYFDDLFWEPFESTVAEGYWDGTKWVAAKTTTYRVGLLPIGSWAVGFEPSYLEVEHDSTSNNFVVEITDNPIAGYQIGVSASNPYVSGTPIALDFTGTGDIGYVKIVDYNAGINPFNVTSMLLY